MLWSASRSTRPASISGGLKGRWRSCHASTMRTSSAITMPGSNVMRCLPLGCWAARTAQSHRAPQRSLLMAKSLPSAWTSWASPTTWRTLRHLPLCPAPWSGPPPLRGPPVPSAVDTSQVTMTRTMTRMMTRMRTCLVLPFCAFLYMSEDLS